MVTRQRLPKPRGGHIKKHAYSAPRHLSRAQCGQNSGGHSICGIIVSKVAVGKVVELGAYCFGAVVLTYNASISHPCNFRGTFDVRLPPNI